MTTELTEAIIRFGEAAKQAASAIAEMIRALADDMPQLLDVDSVCAYAWAQETHPQWVAILNRTKKKRTRKKYQDRIWREYMKSKKETKKGKTRGNNQSDA